MIDLNDQMFTATMASQMMPQLMNIWSNQLAAIDLDVKALQVSYLNTMLMSPIGGVITRIRKNLGDLAKAGEPIIRVEDNHVVLLVGTLTYPGVMAIGNNITVQTTLPGAGGVTNISGKVAAVEGHRSDDEQWTVVIQCENSTPPKRGRPIISGPLLPLNFSLSRDSTTINVT